jgi:hypothetical protein
MQKFTGQQQLWLLCVSVIKACFKARHPFPNSYCNTGGSNVTVRQRAVRLLSPPLHVSDNRNETGAELFLCADTNDHLRCLLGLW